MTRPSDLTEHAARNRAAWDADAANWVESGRRAWASEEPCWGIWHVPESELRLLPDVSDKDVIELGCGTAYWSAWFARLGARVVGLDNSERQLATARELQREHGVEFPLVHASAEATPFPNASFDLAFSEYGACLWCDPELWIPEAARLLRPGGELIFLTNSLLSMLCAPDDGDVVDRLVRPQTGSYRYEWPDDESVEFHLGHGDLIRALRSSGFDIEDLIELVAPESAEETRYSVTSEWAKQWPSEEIWRARKVLGRF
jgi:SAM-dependent methyltransferase